VVQVKASDYSGTKGLRVLSGEAPLPQSRAVAEKATAQRKAQRPPR